MPTGAHPRDPRIDKYSPIADECIRHDMVVGHRLSESICLCARATHASVQGGLRGVDRVEFVITGSVGKKPSCSSLAGAMEKYDGISCMSEIDRLSKARYNLGMALLVRVMPGWPRTAADCPQQMKVAPEPSRVFDSPLLALHHLLHQLLLVLEPADLTLTRLSRIRVRLIRVAPD
jgi:hypothetical protein